MNNEIMKYQIGKIIDKNNNAQFLDADHLEQWRTRLINEIFDCIVEMKDEIFD